MDQKLKNYSSGMQVRLAFSVAIKAQGDILVLDEVLAVGDEDLIKIHFHTNTPWKVLEYCAGLGDIHDVVIENMERQENGLHG